MKTRIFLFLILTLLIQCKNNPVPEGGVVATNAWAAAYALAAGVDDVIVLAPYEMVHPSEYEMRPGDINRIESAGLVIYAGYEVMINQIRNGLDLPEEKMLSITTSYSYKEIEQSVMQIAEIQGTEEIAHDNLEEIKRLFESGRQAFQKNGLDTIPALIHFFQQSFASETGLKKAAVFGPAPLEPKQILSLTKTDASLIIDNAHNPIGGPLQETNIDASYVELLNFPGLYGTRTLGDVIKFNTKQIIDLYEESYP